MDTALKYDLIAGIKHGEDHKFAKYQEKLY